MAPPQPAGSWVVLNALFGVSAVPLPIVSRHLPVVLILPMVSLARPSVRPCRVSFARVPDHMKKFSFYRPHERVPYSNLRLDPKTGELEEIPSMTKQEFVAECDINNIIKQYSTTGQLKHISARAAQGQYLDLPDDLDFQASLEIVRQAQEAFATLPSSTRSRFENDPAQFLAFLSDPANQDEAIKLGFATDTRPPPKAPETPPTANSGVEGGSPPSEGAKAP